MGQITPLVGLFVRFADLCNNQNFNICIYPNSHHFQFTSQESKMLVTPASVETAQKMYLQF